MVGEACLPSNAYYPQTPDCTLYSGIHVCWSEHSDLSFIYGFMSLGYGWGIMTTTTLVRYIFEISNVVFLPFCYFKTMLFLLCVFTTSFRCLNCLKRVIEFNIQYTDN